MGKRDGVLAQSGGSMLKLYNLQNTLRKSARGLRGLRRRQRRRARFSRLKQRGSGFWITPEGRIQDHWSYGMQGEFVPT